MSDLTLARQKLRRLVQGKSESVQNFYERLLTIAKSAYDEANMKEDYLQQQLVEHFLDGLADDGMVRRLIRLKPTTLDKALEHATAEQQAQKAFNIRRGHATESEHTPMEVDVVSTPNEPLTTTLQSITETLVNMQQAIQTLASNQNTQQSAGYGNQPRDAQGRFVVQSDVSQYRNRPHAQANIECYNCRRLGHMAAQCRQPRRLNNQGYNSNPQRRSSNQGYHSNQNGMYRNGQHNSPGDVRPTPRPTYAQVVSNSPRRFMPKNE